MMVTSNTSDDIQFKTRADAEAKVIAEYRAATLNLLSPLWEKLLAVIVPILAISLFLMLPMALAVIGYLAVCLATLIWVRRMVRYDREVRLRANLKPVIDLEALRRQVRVLVSATHYLQQALHPKATDVQSAKAAVDVMFSALRPLLDRGITTIENATVKGYKPYPAIEVMGMPGQEDDLISFHLVRIDASLQRMMNLTDQRIPISQTISQVAGEFVPPLRAIQAQL